LENVHLEDKEVAGWILRRQVVRMADGWNCVRICPVGFGICGVEPSGSDMSVLQMEVMLTLRGVIVMYQEE
jgi:hypothetical protein